MCNKRDRVLKGWKGIPTKSLANYVRDGVVSWNDLKVAGVPDETIEILRGILTRDDDNYWENTLSEHSLQAFRDYVATYPNGNHSDEANNRIGEIDDKEWNVISTSPDKNSLETYKKDFPQGRHIIECNNLLSDLPWLSCKQQNTIKAYQAYKVNYPNRHDKECDEAINILNDDKDWTML